MKHLLLCFVVCLCLFVTPAQARETIHLFDSHVTVHEDGTMTVRETIQVNAEGQSINRGIYRDFPTRYVDTYGHKKTVGFDIIEVLRDGAPEPWHTTKSYDRGIRLYIGDADVLIPHRLHTYSITYKTNRQIGFFDDHDELYWNVTGNEWIFPIVKAQATVVLPPEAVIQDISGYTGKHGAKETAYRAVRQDDAIAFIETTGKLDSYEGLTVAVAWQKGVVHPAGLGQKIIWFFTDNLGALFMALLTCGMGLLYYRRWDRIGRDPRKGVIIPRFSPPDKVSPGLASYILNMGLHGANVQRAFAAALVNMAVKGYITIELVKDKGFLGLFGSTEYKVNFIGDNASALTPAEKALGRRLLGSSSSIMLTQDNHAKIRGALSAFSGKIENENDKAYFALNSGLIYLGWFFTFIMFTFLGVFGASPVVIGCLLIQVALNITFYYLMKAPTVTGRKLMDELEGFRMYMTTAETDRLNAMHPPDMTPEIFEKYLPYAIALGLEQQWGDKLASEVSAATLEQYQPSWYTGNAPFRAGNIDGFTRSLGSSLQSNVSSASIDPTASSGSSGGGFSGGGGGGGGGGGW